VGMYSVAARTTPSGIGIWSVHCCYGAALA
jgi:hypothetical protein